MLVVFYACNKRDAYLILAFNIVYQINNGKKLFAHFFVDFSLNHSTKSCLGVSGKENLKWNPGYILNVREDDYTKSSNAHKRVRLARHMCGSVEVWKCERNYFSQSSE